MRRRLFACLCGLFVFGTAQVALGHGNIPLAEELRGLEGGEESTWALQANFGVITSESPKRYVCEEAFSGGSLYKLAALGPDTWVIFTQQRILRTEDGCNFREVDSLPTGVSDFAVDPESGRVAYALQSDSEQGIWLSTDAGESFEKLETEQPKGIQVTKIEFVGDGNLFASAYVRNPSGDQERGATRLFYAKGPDTSHEMSSYKYSYLLAVDGDKLAWMGRKDDQQVVVWGTFDEPVGATHDINAWPSDATITDGGETLWVSGVGLANDEGRGFLKGTTTDGSFEFSQVFPKHTAECVEQVGETTYVCGRRSRENFDLQSVTSDDSLKGVLNFENLDGPRTGCPAESDVATTCPAVWPDLQRALRTGGKVIDIGDETRVEERDTGPSEGDTSDEGDAAPGDDDASGSSDGGGDVGAADPGTETAEGGCSMATGRRGGAGSVPALAVALLAALWGRRRRHSR